MRKNEWSIFDINNVDIIIIIESVYWYIRQVVYASAVYQIRHKNVTISEEN